MKKKFLLLLLTFVIFSACGYKIVNINELRNFEIKELLSSGDKRVNFLIKNELLLKKNKNFIKKIKVNLETKKTKEIKEKNIQNEITKYEINILVNVKFNILQENSSNYFSINKSGVYEVSKKHSETLNNEKKLIKIISKSIADNIVENLILKLNEL
tara:strand:+ start:505 stop:975 length:471 start_codon:yes stop_codon:yes gene_type:complete